nr:ribosomal protein L9 [Cavernulicola chilensis]
MNTNSNIKIILSRDIKNLGKLGNILYVTNGYAYNYLIPNKFAQIATPGMVNKLRNNQKVAEQEKTEQTKELYRIKNQLEKYNNFLVQKKVGKNHTIFGSITEQDIVSAIQKELNINITKKAILLRERPRKLGTYKIKLKLDVKFFATITLKVIPI